jgi:hypothetical protein
VFLQKQHEKQTGKVLPIFEYSGIHNKVKKQSSLTDQQITTLWAEMCQDFLKKELTIDALYGIKTMTDDVLNMLKIYSMYGAFDVHFGGDDYTLASADMNYSEELKEAVNKSIKDVILNELKTFINNNQDEAEEIIKHIKHLEDLYLISEVRMDNNVIIGHAQEIIKNNAHEMNFTECLEYTSTFNMPAEDTIICLSQTLSLKLPSNIALAKILDMIEKSIVNDEQAKKFLPKLQKLRKNLSGDYSPRGLDNLLLSSSLFSRSTDKSQLEDEECNTSVEINIPKK